MPRPVAPVAPMAPVTSRPDFSTGAFFSVPVCFRPEDDGGAEVKQEVLESKKFSQCSNEQLNFQPVESSELGHMVQLNNNSLKTEERI